MEAYEAIMTRRSIRAYTAQPVDEGLIKELLAAAMSAPSASDRQPWHFVVITERRQLDAMTAILPYGQMLKQAPLAIVVCGDRERQPMEGYWVQDCSAATENILLAAHARGLGAVWLGVYPREERIQGISRLLGLPEQAPPLAVLSIGYPAEQAGTADRYDESRIHRDRW
ncbi:MAG: nitroreductase family protein [Anaerolineae bacterium]|nr:nitroreductase family protein [Anaerolineae bacterium]